MKVYFKITLFIFILFSVSSCTKNKDVIKFEDNTTLIKKPIELTGYLSDFYSKAYSYHWVKDRDTLDFSVNIYERKKDSISTLSFINTESLLFETALDRMKQSFEMIQEDFDISKISTLYFKSPIYFPDLTKALYSEYEQKFGESIIDNQSLDNFLLKSSLTTQLNKILRPIQKRPKRYSIEQFDIVHKENYSQFLPHVNLGDYPKFSLNGTGIYVRLTNFKKAPEQQQKHI